MTFKTEEPAPGITVITGNNLDAAEAAQEFHGEETDVPTPARQQLFLQKTQEQTLTALQTATQATARLADLLLEMNGMDRENPDPEALDQLMQRMDKGLKEAQRDMEYAGTELGRAVQYTRCEC